jgi:hypothetical protein
MKTCNHCYELKEFSDFHIVAKYKDKQYLRPTCKKCHARYSSNKQLESRAKAKPWNYRECDDCGHIFSKMYPRLDCKICGSTNLLDFVRDNNEFR